MNNYINSFQRRFNFKTAVEMMAWMINNIPWFKMGVISYSYRNKAFETHGEN